MEVFEFIIIGPRLQAIINNLNDKHILQNLIVEMPYKVQWLVGWEIMKIYPALIEISEIGPIIQQQNLDFTTTKYQKISIYYITMTKTK